MDTGINRPPQRRKVFLTGRLPMRDPAKCANGCIGPFRPRPDLTEWLEREFVRNGLATEDLLPQYDCLTCGTHRGRTPEELARVA